MTEMRNSSRRSFLKVGAMLATPVGAVAVPAIASATESGDARLTQLESEAAVRELHQQWLRGVNRGADVASLFAEPRRARLDAHIASIAVDHAGEADVIQVSADGVRASGRYHCVVETVTELVPDCTLTQMKHAQGEHMVRDSARHVIEADYVRGERGWAIASLTLA
jgi:hypothetical protein